MPTAKTTITPKAETTAAKPNGNTRMITIKMKEIMKAKTTRKTRNKKLLVRINMKSTINKESRMRGNWVIRDLRKDSETSIKTNMARKSTIVNIQIIIGKDRGERKSRTLRVAITIKAMVMAAAATSCKVKEA